VEFTILGPVEARDGDRVLVGGSGKPVALLTLLLLHRNEVVPVDQLLEDLWGGRAPRTALKTLQTYVSQLRRALGDGVILTRPPGYLLSATDVALDADRFAALLTSGRSALERGDAAQSAARLREGLALWRGHALAEMAYEPWARAAVEQLEEERLQALETRIAADLALGRQRAVVGELEGLVREHPLREHLLSLLMVALYRCGRQTEALDAYRFGRVRLLDDLGIEPTPELQAVEQQILRHDPALSGPRVRLDRPPAAGRRGKRLRATAVAVVLAMAIAFFLALEHGSSGSAHPPAANSLTLVAHDGHLSEEIAVGASPAHAIRAAGFLWTSNERDGTMSRIDITQRTVETIPVGRDPEGLAFADGEVWVANAGDGTIAAIDPRAGKVVRSVAVGNGPVALASRGTELWVADGIDGTLATVDARAGRLIRTVAVGAQPTAVAVSRDGVWVTLAGSGEVVELDRYGRGVIQAVNVGNDPSAVALAAQNVWVANALDGTVSRIDPRSGAVDAVLRLGSAPSSLAVDHGSVWATLADGRLVEFDARSGRLTSSSTIGGKPAAVVPNGSSAWVTTLDSAASHRGGTLRLDTAEISECVCFDPADYPSLASWQLLGLVYDGLVAYRRVGGPAGDSLVGDLAQAVPRPSADGRTYVFRLRSGVLFADGRIVRPSDVRASFERLFQIDHSGLAPFYAHILGARRCVAGHRCDLSRGIVTDDRNGTVTFHLGSVDPDFLYKLALPPAFVVPFGSPMTIMHLPLPGTGPYRVDEALQAHKLALTRNPYFRVFAPEATPDGFPDRIVATTDVSALTQVAAIEHRTTDVATALVDLPSQLVARLATRYASQLHTDPLGATEYLFLNTRIPPFNRLTARQAVNQAVDRARLVQLLGGPTAATPTCQILRPGFPGYRPYCPYGLRPSAAGTSTAPNLEQARKLVARSGTRGVRVHVWAPPDHAAIAIYFAGVLRRLGYRASVHIVSGHTSRYYEQVGDPKRRAQAGWAGWIRDYTSAADFIRPLFTCSGISAGDPTATTNYSRLCEVGIDRRVRMAEQLQQSDPVAAQTAWGAADRVIVDQAAAVPFANNLALTLLSRRTGNYQSNSEWGVLLDQLWVR
jgi:DNA-binding SARP family transcriptional activator/ABC-type transport system substrate-binding protein/streptogramin lyase